MGGTPRMTAPLQRVLLLFLQDPSKRHYGLEIAREADLQRGTLYPMLARLEERRWVTSEWEDIDPVVEGRRPRRYYTLTDEGLRQAQQARDALIAAIGNLGIAGV
ncbi:MAG: PadR family transcriptional regulator [Egibacteraceae bacterium]